ncbi:UNVERIFIED_CONTAM: CCR4-NOT transcription complex subunit [Sesamum calycinum]|uniref:CCR4-NOT transcription complex subunit n=1 Tax=Sesamum calycinum TaxID=2727403 RepID=A0AAW2Q5H0_9LAMI
MNDCNPPLLKCVASHPDTKILFAQGTFIASGLIAAAGELSLFTSYSIRPFEYLRLATLGVMGALVKVATFIVQKLLMDDVGLQYICYLPERVFAVNHALENVLASLAEQPSTRLLKHVIRCYLRFLDDGRSLWVLRNFLPKRLTDGTFDHCLREDQTARMWMQQLLDNLPGRPVTKEGGGI